MHEEDFEVNSTKQRQLRQSLLSSQSSSGGARSHKSKGSSAASRSSQHVEFHEQNLLWLKVVIEFFELQHMAVIERKKAMRIERFFCNLRRMKVKSKLLDTIFKIRGYEMTLAKLPSGGTNIVFSYLSQKDLMTTVSRVRQ